MRNIHCANMSIPFIVTTQRSNRWVVTVLIGLFLVIITETENIIEHDHGNCHRWQTDSISNRNIKETHTKETTTTTKSQQEKW